MDEALWQPWQGREMRKSFPILLSEDSEVGEPDATETGTSGSEGGGQKRAARDRDTTRTLWRVRGSNSTSLAPYPTATRSQQVGNKRREEGCWKWTQDRCPPDLLRGM
jgi:hypothetical protein